MNGKMNKRQCYNDQPVVIACITVSGKLFSLQELPCVN